MPEYHLMIQRTETIQDYVEANSPEEARAVAQKLADDKFTEGTVETSCTLTNCDVPGKRVRCHHFTLATKEKDNAN